MMTVKNKQVLFYCILWIDFSKLSLELPCIPHPVIVINRKFISPLWQFQQGGKQPETFRRIPAPWCTHRLRGFCRRRTEDWRAAHFTSVSGWASSASAVQVPMARVLGWAYLLSPLGQVRQQPWCWSQGTEREGRGKRGPWELPDM